MFLPVLFLITTTSAGRPVNLDDWRGEAIELRVMANVITSLHIDNGKVVQDDVVCGNPGSLVFKPTRDNSQMNIAPRPGAKIGFRTNCNFALDNGISVPVWISIVDKQPDTLVEMHVAANGKAVGSPTAEIDERVYTAVEEYKAKSRLLLATQASESAVSRSLNNRTIQDGIVLALHNHVRLGSVAVVRFSVENRSRSAWPAGEVKIQWYVPGNDPKPLDVSYYFRSPVIESGEEVFCALVTNFYDMPENARFTIQVFEKNGARHPRIDGIKL